MVDVDESGLKGDAERRHATHVKGFGRWIWCKFCYQNRRPVPDFFEDVLVCDYCGYGLDVLTQNYSGTIPQWAQQRAKKILEKRTANWERARAFSRLDEEETLPF